MRVFYTTQFKKDYKRIRKQNKDIELLIKALDLLIEGEPLPARYRDHKLAGEWSDHRDCHIEPDWILIYRITEDSLILERTGSHSELFK
ncbi:type II toxin-antitoxin system YafQ family toxin [candidate division KSB1 bacterium]